VAIVGGGISGLSAAHRLCELAPGQVAVRLLEATERCGGLVRTERRQGLVLEAGPDTVVTQKPEALELCRRLGLEHELIYPWAQNGAIEVAHRGRLIRLPEGTLTFVPTRRLSLLRSPLLSWRGKARALLEILAPAHRATRDDESLRAFVTRRFGRELFERLAEPVIGGLFLADADHMSMQARLPRLLALEREHGSVTRGILRGAGRTGPAPPPLVAPRGGMGTLVDRLVARLPADWIVTRARVERLERDRTSGGFRLQLGEHALVADVLLLACPAHASAALVQPLDVELSRDLARLEHADCATVHLAYRRADLPATPRSFGFFVPRTAGSPLVACNFVSVKFPERVSGERVLLRAFVGGALHPGVLGLGDFELVAQAHAALARLLALGGRPVFARVHRHPRSMPQFPVGDRVRLERVVARTAGHPGLHLCGAAIGAFGIPDCIRSGEDAARRTVERAGERSASSVVEVAS
jgi:oxygen-dependent protoporphyrinogen oxidase